MWWFSLFPWLVAPCAALAGVAVWLLTGDRKPSDGELLRDFLVALAMLLMVSLAITRTEFIRSRFDEGYQGRVAWLKMPVHVALRQHRPDEWKQMHGVAVQAFDALVPPATVLTQTRKQYPALARKMIATAQTGAVMAYAQALVPALDELRVSDPPKCVRLAWPQVPADAFDASLRLSGPVNLAYEQAIARLVAENTASAVKGAWKTEPTASLQEVQASLDEVRKATAEKHGDAANQVHTIGVADMDPVAACAATSELIARTLKLEPRVARAVLTQLLKG
ncbi:hypothetical protein WG902_05265 [Ramlibacter sp. PS3R-8]|uniref:hypothetical protein n=1 Tax=Ramlibacter sp. PS3R-8 TaxID=3133437 RepID=UPI0030A133CD